MSRVRRAPPRRSNPASSSPLTSLAALCRASAVRVQGARALTSRAALGCVLRAHAPCTRSRTRDPRVNHFIHAAPSGRRGLTKPEAVKRLERLEQLLLERQELPPANRAQETEGELDDDDGDGFGDNPNFGDADCGDAAMAPAPPHPSLGAATPPRRDKEATAQLQAPQPPCCRLRGLPAIAACDAINEQPCKLCQETHAPADVAVALDATRQSAGLAARASLDCRELDGDAELPRPSGGPAIRCVESAERLAAFERINGPLSPPDDLRPPPPLQAARLVVRNTKLLVLAKMPGAAWWPGLVAVCERGATGTVHVDFLPAADGHARVSQGNLKPFTEADINGMQPSSNTKWCAAMTEARHLLATTTQRHQAERPRVEVCKPVLVCCEQCSRLWYFDYVWELCRRLNVGNVLNVDGSDVRELTPPPSTHPHTHPHTHTSSHPNTHSLHMHRNLCM